MLNKVRCKRTRVDLTLHPIEFLQKVPIDWKKIGVPKLKAPKSKNPNQLYPVKSLTTCDNWHYCIRKSFSCLLANSISMVKSILWLIFSTMIQTTSNCRQCNGVTKIKQFINTIGLSCVIPQSTGNNRMKTPLRQIVLWLQFQNFPLHPRTDNRDVFNGACIYPITSRFWYATEFWLWFFIP